MDKIAIVYLDDEDGVLQLFVDIFGAEFDVRTATTPGDARGLLAECRPDIIISDQNMPEIEGTEFLRECMEAYPQCVRVMVTGAAGAGQMLGQISEGLIQVFVRKPWVEADMREALGRARVMLGAPSS